MSALSSSTSSTLQSLGSALSSLTQSQQVSILNNLVGSLVNPALGDISNEIGTYNAFPMLKATPTGSVTPGTYAGTMTVTLVQP
jgi:type 1 fimbria pilin